MGGYGISKIQESDIGGTLSPTEALSLVEIRCHLGGYRRVWDFQNPSSVLARPVKIINIFYILNILDILNIFCGSTYDLDGLPCLELNLIDATKKDNERRLMYRDMHLDVVSNNLVSSL